MNVCLLSVACGLSLLAAVASANQAEIAKWNPNTAQKTAVAVEGVRQGRPPGPGALTQI